MKLRTFAAAALLAVAAPALGQDLPPRNVMPTHVNDNNGGMRTMSWDGRLVVTLESFGGWSIRVFRPENVTTGPNGVPDLSGAVRSDELGLEKDGDPSSGMGDHNNLTMFPTPSSPLVNPFRSQQDGTPDPSGLYECYEATVITTYYHVPGGHDQEGMRRLRVVVHDPKTPKAGIQSAQFLEPWQQMTTTTGQPINAIEPTVTADGRLLIAQGHPNNDGTIDTLIYSYNATPGQTTGWSPPRSVADLYFVDRSTVLDGISLADRFPIAQQPLKAPNGTVFSQGQIVHGAYPWISHDGTELFFCACIAGTPGVDQARRGASSVVGRWTGWAIRHIDGPINPTRTATTRFNVLSPGAKPSFWKPYRETPGAPFPYTAARPVFPVFGSTTDDLNDISFEDHEDQDYVLALRMNESIATDGTYDTAHTPDTSGNFNTGILEGARFPIEHDGTDAIQGVVGQALYFAEGDRVRVPYSASVAAPRNKLSVELWVKRLVDLGQDGQNRFRYLLNRGNWNLILEVDGSIQATVKVNGQDRRSGGIGPQLNLNEWTHVAFTYDGDTGNLRVLLRGQDQGGQSFGQGQIDDSQQDLIVGNGGQTQAAPFIGTRDAIYMIDDVRISDVVRTSDEIARAAYYQAPPPTYVGGLSLPQGLDPAQLRLPEPVTPAAVDLGKMLFFDKRLSIDGSTSCATCHDPAHSFTDGKPVATGLAGVALRRNTPTIVNRALSTAQFFDGRAASLEEQATAPIENPREMGNTVDAVAQFLSSSSDYASRFQSVYGSAPSRGTIARAIAAFERSVLSGASAVDRFVAGDSTALGDAEKHGFDLFRTKARCIACHDGSNFTDESFHATAQASSVDGGRAEITGRHGDENRFKTPTLREISETAPYLNDGSANALEDVVNNYNQGGTQQGSARDPEIRPLGLTDGEKADLVAFLRALRGTSVNVAPPALPPDPPGYQAQPTPTPPAAPTPPGPPSALPSPAPAPPPPQPPSSGGGGFWGWFKNLFSWL